MRIATTLLLLAGPLLAGCRPDAPSVAPTTQWAALGLSEPVAMEQLDAVAVPPASWTPAAPKQSGQHEHQVWLSPTGDTAYGIIRFSMPLPVGEDLALWGFLREMKRSEGEANLLSSERDAGSGAMRFVAEGGLYVIRGTLLTRGFHGWAVYAGTLRNKPIRQEELELARRARENTALGLGGDAAPTTTNSRPATQPSGAAGNPPGGSRIAAIETLLKLPATGIR